MIRARNRCVSTQLNRKMCGTRNKENQSSSISRQNCKHETMASCTEILFWLGSFQIPKVDWPNSAQIHFRQRGSDLKHTQKERQKKRSPEDTEKDFPKKNRSATEGTLGTKQVCKNSCYGLIPGAKNITKKSYHM